jgi:hypothetical protein
LWNTRFCGLTTPVLLNGVTTAEAEVVKNRHILELASSDDGRRNGHRGRAAPEVMVTGAVTTKLLNTLPPYG